MNQYQSLDVVVILPAYNEEKTIANAIRSMARVLPVGGRIVVVDNRSSDETGQVARDTLAKERIPGEVLFESRPGKGNAIRRAFREIEADVYAMVDADCTYVAEDLAFLLEPVLKGKVELAVGNRHANRAYVEQNRRMFHDFGNRLVRSLINLLFGTRLQDIMSGYRVMSRRFAKTFPVLSEGFELETEMTLHAVDKRFGITEVPIQYLSRPAGSKSKLNTYVDGMRVLKTILWIFKNFRPFAFFLSVAGAAFVAGIAIGTPVILEFMETGLVPKFPSAILASALVIISILLAGVGLILDTVTHFQRFQFELHLLRDFPTAFRISASERGQTQ